MVVVILRWQILLFVLMYLLVQPPQIKQNVQSPIQTLTATAIVPAGETVVWYDSPTGGNTVANPILNTIGTKIYYAQRTTSSCVSPTARQLL
jgi:hypothetical protein